MLYSSQFSISPCNLQRIEIQKISSQKKKKKRRGLLWNMNNWFFHYIFVFFLFYLFKENPSNFQQIASIIISPDGY